MAVLRTIAAVLVGYLLFALASTACISSVITRDGAVFVGLALVSLAGIGLVAGFAASRIAGGTARLAGRIVAGLVALATLANLLMQLGAEPAWYKIGTLVLTVPGILLATHRRRG